MNRRGVLSAFPHLLAPARSAGPAVANGPSIRRRSRSAYRREAPCRSERYAHPALPDFSPHIERLLKEANIRNTPDARSSLFSSLHLAWGDRSQLERMYTKK